jgi:1,4-dihydroxy-2-naphthoate octaprenyltransferase
LGGSRVAEKERFPVYSALASRFSKAVLTMVRRVRGILKHFLSGPTARRFWQLVGKKASLSLEKIRRIATLSTAMAVLALLLFVGIVLGYI